MGDKTEKATPKKLRDAKKKGQIAKSQDLPAAFTCVASVAIVLALSHSLYSQLANFLVTTFRSVGHADLSEVVLSLFYKANEVIFLASIPTLALVALVGVTITFLTVGPVFAPEVFKFDPKKFNPVDNLKAKFKMKTLVELLKSCLKISIAAYLIYGVMYKSIPLLIQTVSMPIAGALIVFHSFLIEVILKVGLFFVIVAVADFIYQKKTFNKEMMMEKFEIKQEYKNSEGDPHIKGKRKQIAQEIAYSEGPTGGAKRAQAVVTNPTHLAIAIGYERHLDAAPYILAMGKDILAERIVKIAEKNDIPILRNIPLAHTLWEEGEVYEYVPEDTYEALAEIMRWVASLKDGTEMLEPLNL
jgi:type III secretion YscU/HrpY family protein